ncbi:MAG: 1-deoxy-D-xylulose-5-phosphate reductoisomerase [Bacteroidota bacterium]
MMKSIAILGSTGSIGKQALEVVHENPEAFRVEVLTAQNNAALLVDQAKKYKPNAVVIGNPDKYQEVSRALWSFDIKTYAGTESLEQVVEMNSIDVVLVALVGFAGLMPSLNALKHRKPLAIANKESLVVAGDLVTQAAKQNQVPLLPVDSEHSAIFQCLAGEYHNPVEKIYLTASGGPFHFYSKAEMKNVTRKQALTHPNWNMGDKITIDSATMMNKGLEVIEARWLFDLKPEQIDIIVHPQSVIHSMVQFTDGSMKAQMGLPDMKIPIQYAFTFPERLSNSFQRFNFTDYPTLTFQKPDFDKFAGLSLSYEALRKGGNMPCVLNAANETAVKAFLEGKIGFLDVYKIIEQSMQKVHFIAEPQIDEYCLTDKETRKVAASLI